MNKHTHDTDKSPPPPVIPAADRNSLEQVARKAACSHRKAMESMAQNETAKQDSPVTHAADMAQKYATEPLACRRCGAITLPRVTPGSGPHALKANCPECGSFMQWLSKHTPEERARRHAQARLDAMGKLAPTALQLAYLTTLGDRNPPPANRAAASQRIDQLKAKKGVA